jgi:hypothetical protein
MTLPTTLCIHPVLPSNRISSSIMQMIDSIWKFLPRLGMSSLTLEFEKSSFPFRVSDWVGGPRRSSNEAQHKESYEAQSDSTMYYVAHARKEKPHRKLRSFLLSTVSISSFLHDQCIIHRFLCSPSFHKS